MKILLHITSNGVYVVGDDRTGQIFKYTKKDLTNGQPFKIRYLSIKKKIFVDSSMESKLKSDAVSVLSALCEEKRIIGYMLYVPAEDKLVCVSGDKAADYATKYGLVYGKIRSFSSNSKRYIEGKFHLQPAYFHKQIYMDLYRERKEAALKSGKQVEKIVRPNINTLEIRYLPTIMYDTYKEPKGANIYNLKWWKLEDGKIKLLKRPQAKVLDLSKYCEEIMYYGVDEKYESIVDDTGVSLGAFSHWNIDSVVFGNKLNVIGRESFIYNNLTAVKITKSVKEIGEKAFMNNLIERLFFCKGVDLKLGAYAFSNNNLKEVYIPSTIISIDKGCFSGNIDLTKVSFDKNSKLTVLESKVFEDCAIKSIKLPDSIVEVKNDAFCGCNSLKELTIGINSKLNNKSFISDMENLGIKVLINE